LGDNKPINPAPIASACRRNNWRNFFKRPSSKLLKACPFRGCFVCFSRQISLYVSRAVRSVLGKWRWLTKAPLFMELFFPTPEILILVKVFYFRCVLFLILILSSVAAMAAGRKDQESDGWASRFDAPYSVAFTLQIDFWKQRKKPGQMCTKMPFLILIVLDAFQYLRGYLMLLLPLISVKLVGGFFL
jgi:hypothetical protein